MKRPEVMAAQIAVTEEEDGMVLSFSRVIDISQPLYDHCPGNPAFPAAARRLTRCPLTR